MRTHRYMSTFIFYVMTAIVAFFAVRYLQKSHNIFYTDQPTTEEFEPAFQPIAAALPTPPDTVPIVYKPVSFYLSGVTGLSAKQLDQHQKLYRGYVKKRNEIKASLAIVDKSNANPTYSPYRSLKLGQSYAHNGAILHQLYFEALRSGTNMGPQTKTLLEEQFGSITAFKEDLFACAGSARGWCLTCYSMIDGHVDNFMLDTHDEIVPVMTIPFIVVDVYEHAYMIDFGISRKEYLDILWNNINWDMIEQRIVTWTTRLSTFDND